MAIIICIFIGIMILFALALTPINSPEVLAGFTPTFTPLPPTPTFTPVPPTPTPVPPPPPTPTPTLAPLLPVTGGSFNFMPGLVIILGAIAFAVGLLGRKLKA